MPLLFVLAILMIMLNLTQAVFHGSRKPTSPKQEEEGLFSQISVNFTNVDQLIMNWITNNTNRTFPGVVLQVSRDQQVLHSKAYGNQTYPGDPLYTIPMSENTLFDMASVSKVISTTSCAMHLYETGQLALDDLLIKYVPEANNKGKGAITIRNLLLHNAGLPPFYQFYNVPNVTASFVFEYIHNVDLMYPIGTQYLYSDFSMILLMEVIQRITNKTLDVFAQEVIFNKMEMISTMYNPPIYWWLETAPTENDTYWRNRVVKGTVHDECAAILGGVSGHAGLFSTSTDLIKFMQMMLHRGMYINSKGQEVRVFQEATVDLFTTRVTDVPYNNSRALGWDTVPISNTKACGDYFSPRSFGHTGFTGTSVWADKDKNLAVVILTNRVYPQRDPTANRIVVFRNVLMNSICQTLGYNKTTIDEASETLDKTSSLY